ncbi:hypothetical protein ABEF93_000514 [Exophiala dermatitidis]
MAVQQTGPAAPPISIPSRSSSLDEQPRFYVPFLESAYITWPAPRSRYTPPKPSSPDDVDVDVVEPFPDFQDPSANLIIARTVLLDNLHRQGCARDPAAPLSTPFRSLYSRITPLTGHIKVDEDLTRQRASVDHIMEIGQTVRTQRMLGNTAKPVSLGGTYPVSMKDPEPKDFLKDKLKKQAKNGITEAIRIQKALECFASDAETENNDHEHERGRSTSRKQRRALAAIHTTYGPERAIQNLLMLRETYPAYFMPGTLNAAVDMTKTSNPDTQESRSKALVISSKPAVLSTQGLQGLGIYPAPLASHPSSDKSGASSTTSSNGTVAEEDNTPAETEDLSSEKQNQMVTLKPVPSEGGAVAIPSSTKTMTLTPSDSTVAAETRNDSNEMASKRHGRCFYIEREPVTVLPAELEEKDESDGEIETESYRSRSQSDSAVITSFVSADESSLDSDSDNQYTVISPRSSFDDSVPAVQVAEMVTLTKPSSPPRLINIPARKSKTAVHDDKEWVIVNKPLNTAVQGKSEPAHHPHAFRGYVTGGQSHPLRRPRSMISLPTRHIDHSGDAYAVVSNNADSDSNSSADSESESDTVGSHVLSNMVSALGRELFGRHPV